VKTALKSSSVREEESKDRACRLLLSIGLQKTPSASPSHSFSPCTTSTMIREYHQEEDEYENPSGKCGRSRTPRPGASRPARPWHVAKKPKPFKLSKADMEELKANTNFEEEEIM